MDSTEPVDQPDPSSSRTDEARPTDDDADIAAAVHWLAQHYLMSDASARVLLSQLARQDGVTEAVAARSLAGTTTTTDTDPGETIPMP